MGAAIYACAASFQSPNKIKIGLNDVIYAEKVVISTGSSPVIPNINGLD
ncbi:hypothetical protein KP78_28720 [Jeotgalibacillus soli]|uniref:Uncharacterized protein n=1 Tax=Jeotgalibacillus soli TaxID=889306 RepID=A0A0C2VMU5_9BACL|nr:hypothetical protein KP78_28720 [Jeotgalibacillus soli]